MLPRTISSHRCHLRINFLAGKPPSSAQSTRFAGKSLNPLDTQIAMNSPLRYVAGLLWFYVYVFLIFRINTAKCVIVCKSAMKITIYLIY